MPSAPPVAQAFLDALARHDFAALEATLDPLVQFRALVPGENVAVGTAAEAVACFRRWFGDKTDIEIVDRRVETLIDRLRVEFHARLKKDGQPLLIAQNFCGGLSRPTWPPPQTSTPPSSARSTPCGSAPREARTA